MAIALAMVMAGNSTTKEHNMTEAQEQCLKYVAAGDPINIVKLDGRSVRALSKRGFIKVRATKAGSLVSITAKGKKELN